MKACPFCAEQIQDAAIVCKHCQRDLPESDQTPRGAQPPAARQSFSPARLVGTILLIACGGMVLVFLTIVFFTQRAAARPPFDLVAQQGTMARFVVVTPDQAKSDEELWRVADYLAKSSNGVQVMFWTSPFEAANAFPLEERHLASMAAEIWINKTTGLRELKRRPFAGAATR